VTAKARAPIERFVSNGSIVIRREFRQACIPLRSCGTDGFTASRFGNPNAGRYILVEGFEGIDRARSFGIAQDRSRVRDTAKRDLAVGEFAPPYSAQPPVTDDPCPI